MLLATQGCRPKEKTQKVRVAAAANMQYALSDICDAFYKATGGECQLVIGSSGKLTAQIREGAPFDLFLAADRKYPEYLYRLKKTEGEPRIYANGRLVLWTVQEDLDLSLGLLQEASLMRIALANPELAPYGLAAMQVLDRNGMLDTVRHKIIFGESIAQANQFVESGAAEVGITALSVKNAPPMKDRGQWLLLSKSEHDPIEQAVVLIASEGGPSPVALEFYSYLFSDPARRILRQHGYQVDE